MPIAKTKMIEAAYRDAKTLSLADGNACYVRKGAGAPVILLHGIPVSLLTWRRNLDALSAGLDVIALDLKGFGMSGKEPGSLSPEAHARFVLQLMDKLRLPQVSLAGSSYGCAVALTLAHKYPEKVDKLVLINSVGFPGGRHALERMVRMKVLHGVLESTLRSILGKRIFANGLRKSYADPALATTELIDSYYHLLRSGAGERTFLNTLEEFDEGRLSEIIPQIKHESLLIWGAQDHILPPSNGERFHKEMRLSRLQILPECGHFPHEEGADRVNALILQFLRKPASAADDGKNGNLRRPVARTI